MAIEEDFRAHWREHGGIRIATEWSAVLTELQAIPEVAAERIGYWGLSLGTQTGLAFLATDRRVKAAVLGLSALPLPGPRIEAYARGVRCPTLLLMQRHDRTAPADRARALYAAITGVDKTVVESDGGHEDVPAEAFEAAYEFLSHRLLAQPK